MKFNRTTIKLAYISVFLLISTNILQSQTKKEVQFSLDTIQKSLILLQQDYHSIQEEWKKQNLFFEHVKSTFFADSDVNMSIDDAVINFDSINQSRIKQMKTLTETNAFFSDSIQKMNEKIKQLAQQNKSYSNLFMSSLNKASFPQSEIELIGIWDLFLDPVQLTGEPYESGLICYNQFVSNDSLMQYNLYKIEFSPDEIATLYFTGGKTQKCFYSMNDFSLNSPYFIHFSKQDEFKLTMHVSPVPNGLMISYEVPVKTENVKYFYGLMKK